MKTVLFSSCFLEGKDKSGSDRFERTIRWIEWYRKIKSELGFDYIWLADNCSSYEKTFALGKSDLYYSMDNQAWLNYPPEHDLSIWSFRERLIGGNWRLYPYCWRALNFLRSLIEEGQYEKIIVLDSDSFVLTKRLASHIKNLNSGWETFYSEKYAFPMAEAHVLCKDSFQLLLDFTSVHWMTHMGKLMEISLPFTKVNPDFQCDRFGEDRIPQKAGMDLYTQAPVDLPLEFGKFE